MADTLQIGPMNTARTDLASVVLDLNSTSSGIQLVRDTFKTQAPDRRAQFSDTNRRWGGSRQASESHGNGTIGANFYTQKSTANAAIDLWESLIGAAESNAQNDYFIKWKPEGATNSVFYEIRGNASWEASYRWIEFQANKVVVFSVTWPVAPLARGAATTFSTSAASYPATIQLSSAVGGSAPALLDLTVANPTISSAGVGSDFFMVGWSQRPGTPVSGSNAPFGLIDVSSGATGVTSTGFTAATSPARLAISSPSSLGVTATVSSASASGTTYTYTTSAAHTFLPGASITVTGSSVAAYNGTFTITSVTSTTFVVTGGTPSPATPTFTSGTATSNYTVNIDVDPSTLRRDDFTDNEIDLEVWARVGVNASHSVTVVTSLSSKDTTGVAARYTAEYGSTGKLLTVPGTGSGYLFYRLGTITATVDTVNKPVYTLKLAPSFSANSSDEFSIDSVVIVPAKQRALTPTGRENDATYPKFINSTSANVKKLIKSDLSGWIYTGTGTDAYFPDSGLGGQLLEIPTGTVDLFVKSTRGVPDDPTPSTADDANQTLTVTGTIIPRYYLGRGTT